MKRLVEESLNEWKERSVRKPLLLRGARQVGKTWSVRKLGDSFEQFLECNFEQDTKLVKLFDGDLSAQRICERISAYTGHSIVPGKMLLFLDEIQVCPNALRSLRFLYEQMPELHVIAAGSLLEFAMAELPSFGVGRIESLFMCPLNFREFAMARDEESMLEEVLRDKEKAPSVFHEKLLETLRIYMVLGGFPEVVKTYLDTHDIPACERALDTLYSGLQDDFSKYRSRVPAHRINATFRAAILQAGGKFVYNHVSPDLDQRQVKVALELLQQAGLLHAVVHTAAQGIPIGAQENPRRFKIIPCDLGLYYRILEIPTADMLFSDNKTLVNKGASAEIFAGLELLAASSRHRKASLHYWQKEKRDGNAEVDYVVQKGTDIIPVEVKAGTRGAMQSMRIFLESHPASIYGIRTSLENFGNINNKIQVIPLYALGDCVRS